MDEVIRRRRYDVFVDKKWEKFTHRARLCRHIPFVEFVMASGSLAYGRVRRESDFDVIVGAKKGRIFMARFFSVFAFGMLGWRRKKLAHDEDARDKICLNHFVTPESYRLRDPQNKYWQSLYFNLVPLYGSREQINLFFAANADWMKMKRIYVDDLRHIQNGPSGGKRFIEFLFSGSFGNVCEAIAKKIQVSRSMRSLKEIKGVPRVVYADTELEFHVEPENVRWDGEFWVWK